MVQNISISDNYGEKIADNKYAFAYVGTEMTNAVSLAMGIVAFDDWDEVRDQFDEDEIKEMQDMASGESTFNDNYWTIIRIK